MNSGGKCYQGVIHAFKDHFKRNCPKVLKAEDPLSIPSPTIQVIREKGPTMDKDIKIDTPVAKDTIKSPSPIRSRRSSQENNGTDTESVNGVREVEPNLGANLREQCWLIDSGATTHTSCNRELFTSLDEVSFKIKVANQKFVQVVGKTTSQVLRESRKSFSYLKYHIIKGTKIEVLFNNGTIQLTNDGKEVGDVIVTSGLAYFIPTMNTTQVIANFSNDGVKNGKEEGEKDDNADSDT
ncbi:hypothetical protein E2320_022619, partial [Naja naja]